MLKKEIWKVNEPPLIQSCTNIQQFVKQPFQINYPNHMQSVERAVKMTTTASGRIAGSERQIGEALCSIAGRKKQWIGKKYTTSQEKLLMLVNKIKATIAVCIALMVFFW